MIDKYLESFYKNIKILRKGLDVSQRKIAEQLGIAHQSYQAYESGLTKPTFENFLKLCEIFDVTPNELLDYA